MPPYQPDQQVLGAFTLRRLTGLYGLTPTSLAVIAGDYRGERGITRSQDGEDYWVERPGDKRASSLPLPSRCGADLFHLRAASMVVNVAYLVELA